MTAIGPGVRVKCIKRGDWCLSDIHGPGPEFGTVWTIKGAEPGGPYSPPGKYLFLVEWLGYRSFHESRFVPLDGNEDISALLAALNIPKAIVGNDDIAVSAPELDEVEAK